MKYLFLFTCLNFSVSVKAQLSDFTFVDFHRADSIAENLKEEDLSNLPILAYNLTSQLTSEVEQFRAIYYWVCQNIDNYHEYFLKNKRKREKYQQDSVELSKWNSSFKENVFKKLFEEQRTICTGYAYLIKELANLADINCEIIDGYGRTVESNIGKLGIPNHSWNAVELNGKWYLCDATWSSGSNLLIDSEYFFIRDFGEGYFLAEPALFIKNHFPLDTSWSLLDIKIDVDEFVNAPIVYKGSFNYKVIPVSPKSMVSELMKGEKLFFSFIANDSIGAKEITLIFSIGTRNFTVKPKVNYKNNLLEIEHQFNHVGLYDVHFKIDGSEIASYMVKVKKNRNRRL